ncbi:MAG: hypothetical protein AAGC62_13860, partial [Pseudomonadota bacterium]
MLGGLAVAERVGSTWVHESLAADEMDPILMGAILFVYVAMLALPFVPGAESQQQQEADFSARHERQGQHRHIDKQDRAH